jgi:uncharacterized protein (DUF2147 family)
MRLAMLLFVAVSPFAFAAPAPSPLLGTWSTPTGSIVRVEPCASDICLRVLKLPPDAPNTLDAENPDKSLRSRTLCGLVIGTGFQPDDPTHLSGGHLYDPKSGRTYRGTIVADGDTLKLHGYIGISAFGRSEVWHHAAPVAACR